LKHVEDSNKHIIGEIVRQGGYLPELYKDARSEKYKKKNQYASSQLLLNLIIF